MSGSLNDVLVQIIKSENIPLAIKLKKIDYLVKLGCNLNEEDSEGFVALMHAKEKEVAEKLIELGADCNHVHCKSGKNVLYYAKSFEVAKLLVDRGIDVYSCFEDAVRYNNKDLALWLIKLGADINGKTEYGLPYVHVIAERANVDMFKEVFPYITDINVKDQYGQTCLMHVVRGLPFDEKERVELAEFLIDNGIDVNAVDEDGQSFLFGLDNNVKILQKAIENGADINLCDNKGENVLHYVLYHGSFWGRKQFVECLIDNGANFNQKNLQGESPMLEVIGKEDLYEAALKMVLSGADVDVKADGNWTPLMLALKECNYYNKKETEDKFILALIEKTNDINAVNNGGKSAFSICLKNRLDRFMEPLISKGAIISKEDKDYIGYRTYEKIKKIQKRCRLKKVASKNLGKKKRSNWDKTVLAIKGEFSI